jgi:hypothetical protein
MFSAQQLALLPRIRPSRRVLVEQLEAVVSVRNVQMVMDGITLGMITCRSIVPLPARQSPQPRSDRWRCSGAGDVNEPSVTDILQFIKMTKPQKPYWRH